MRRALMALVLCWAVEGPTLAHGQGLATALGSDTLMLGATIVQLNGLDGVEFHQFCFVDGQAWACGAPATRALQTLLDGIVVSCTPTGGRNGDAVLAVCSGGGEDIGEIMVQRGWALANPLQSDAYVAAEKAARENGAGIWRGVMVEPWAYREDIAAIESRYSARAGDAIRTEAEQALANGHSLEAFAMGRIRTLSPSEDVAASDHEVRVTELAPGFVPGAIEARGVFSWPEVSRVLAAWRRSGVDSVIAGTQDPVWEGLLSRPSQVVIANNDATYYAAMRSATQQWIGQGRQPILLVSSPTVPSWVGQWFGDAPPPGARISHRADIDAPDYLGTVDGVDVYVGPVPPTDSLLFPDDLLIDAGYRPNADGAILTIEHRTQPAPGELIFRYSMALEWTDDVVVWLRYPYNEVDIYDE